MKILRIFFSVGFFFHPLQLLDLCLGMGIPDQCTVLFHCQPGYFYADDQGVVAFFTVDAI